MISVVVGSSVVVVVVVVVVELSEVTFSSGSSTTFVSESRTLFASSLSTSGCRCSSFKIPLAVDAGNVVEGGVDKVSGVDCSSVFSSFGTSETIKFGKTGNRGTSLLP